MSLNICASETWICWCKKHTVQPQITLPKMDLFCCFLDSIQKCHFWILWFGNERGNVYFVAFVGADLSFAKISRILFLRLTFKVTFSSFENAIFALEDANLCANGSFVNVSKITKHNFQMQKNPSQHAFRIPQVWHERCDVRDIAYGETHGRVVNRKESNTSKCVIAVRMSHFSSGKCTRWKHSTFVGLVFAPKTLNCAFAKA